MNCILVWECSNVGLKSCEFLIFLVQSALKLEIERFVIKYIIHWVDVAVHSFFFVFCVERDFNVLKARNEVQCFSV